MTIGNLASLTRADRVADPAGRAPGGRSAGMVVNGTEPLNCEIPVSHARR